MKDVVAPIFALAHKLFRDDGGIDLEILVNI